MGDQIELPDQLPTTAVIAAIKHVVDHTHEGVDVGHHFIGALLEELGLLKRGPASENPSVTLSDFYTHRAQAVLVVDPDADPAIVDFVQVLLADGGTGAARHEFVGPVAAGEEIIGRHIQDRADLVIVVRTERHPSREVTTAARLAREHGKPLLALVLPGLDAGVEAIEVQELEPTPSDPAAARLDALRRWSVELPKRFGHPISEE